MHYYDSKYPFLKYHFRFNDDNRLWIMYSVPVRKLVEMYKLRMGEKPRSFFDCGAATGELIRQADIMGIDARGCDVKTYQTNPDTEKYFASGRIQIKSILDCEPVCADLAYCNGTLTYMNKNTLPMALEKFKTCGMLIAIHNTREDIVAAQLRGDELLQGEQRLIRPNSWWLRHIADCGFAVDFDTKYNCFCAIPYPKTRY